MVSRVLVCGGRRYNNRDKFMGVMRDLDADEGPFNHLINGGAGGADYLARQWADIHCVPISHYPANWKQFGRAAGPIRNQQMLDEGRPDLVIAFSGGPGTADMVARAKSAGVRIIQVPA